MTTLYCVVIFYNMKANLLLKERVVQSEYSFAELIVWQVPLPVPGSRHQFKYRLAYVVKGCCVLRYDNEAGKSDHKHVGEMESNYTFTTPAQLLTDFWHDVDQWRQDNE